MENLHGLLFIIFSANCHFRRTFSFDNLQILKFQIIKTKSFWNKTRHDYKKKHYIFLDFIYLILRISYIDKSLFPIDQTSRNLGGPPSNVIDSISPPQWLTLNKPAVSSFTSDAFHFNVLVLNFSYNSGQCIS